MSDRLAIVIPAYRSEFFPDTLDSLANQTCKDFTVYVGDDASPDDIKGVVARFEEKLNIEYRRFEDNLGGKDLSSHWKRCVDMVRDENWIWMFSDDDIAQPECVESFYANAIPEGVNVVHFNLDIIDGTGQIIRSTPDYPQNLSPADYFNMLYRRQIDARMQEFVFRADVLKKEGFVSFDLAWRTDNATVMNMAFPKGIYTIYGDDSRVKWRAGNSNISVNTSLSHRKNRSTVDFFNWTEDFFNTHSIANPMGRFYWMKTIVFQLEYHGNKMFWREGRMAAHGLDMLGFFDRIVFRILMLYRLIY